MDPRALLGQDRISPRRRLRAPCQVVRERDFKLVATRTIDLSDGGALVAADVPVAIGESVIVSFRPPRTTRWVDAVGVVTRLVGGRRRGDVGRAFGVRLSPLDRSSNEALRVALQRLPEVQAARVRRAERSAPATLAMLAIESRFGRG